MIVFQSQFEAVDSPTPLERIGSGKISPTTTQAQGPQVLRAHIQPPISANDQDVDLRCEKEDVNGDESYLSIDSTDVLGDLFTSSVGGELVEPDSDPDDGDDKLTGSHKSSSVNKERSSSDFLD